MNVGRYAGKRIDTLPNSYLRWLIGQQFPKEWIEIAKHKLAQSDYNNMDLELSRHAIDMFSKRFVHLWKAHTRDLLDDADGIATFITKMAQRAWEEGRDVSKKRYTTDGIRKELDGVIFVFSVNSKFPEFKTVVTIMSSTV